MIPLAFAFAMALLPGCKSRCTFLLCRATYDTALFWHMRAAQASYVIKFIALLQLDEKPSQSVFPDCCSKFRAWREMGYGDLAVLTTATKLSSIGLFSTYLIHMSLSPRSKSVIAVEISEFESPSAFLVSLARDFILWENTGRRTHE